MALPQDPLAPMINLVNRLRGELDEKVLEAKRTKLRVAEATLELLLSKRKKAIPSAKKKRRIVVHKAPGAGPRGSQVEGVMPENQQVAPSQASERAGVPTYLAM
jgi:hypothetical protein